MPLRSLGLTQRQAESLGDQHAISFEMSLAIPQAHLQCALRALGGRINIVSPMRLSETDDRSLDVAGVDDFDIFIPDDIGPSATRWRTAHEIAHYILHYLRQPNKIGSRFQAPRFGTGRAELEADWFAAAFLMPSTPFMEAFYQAAGDTGALSVLFGLDITTIQERAGTLGLLGNNPES